MQLIGMSECPFTYLNVLVSRLRDGDQETRTAWGRHIHWGYWQQPQSADGSADDFAQAAEVLCRMVCDGAKLKDAMRILDVGCGVGGTVASLNERFKDVSLVGVNIDPQQLGWAKENVSANSGSSVQFCAGDACALPFPAESFDALLAVECIFHFPSREEFFRQAWRVLRPGGILSLSDFVPLGFVPHLLGLSDKVFGNSLAASYGRVNTEFSMTSYQRLAEKTGFSFIENKDITANTLPTYPYVVSYARRKDRSSAHTKAMVRITKALSLTSRLGIFRYRILAFQKPM